jgi:transposase
MRAYSIDLRQRILAEVDAGTPRAEVARRLRVSLATIERLLKQRREQGHVTPKTSPGRPPHIQPQQHQKLAAQLRTNPDATLLQQCQQWQHEQGTKLSVWSMARTIKRLEWSHKKRA